MRVTWPAAERGLHGVGVDSYSSPENNPELLAPEFAQKPPQCLAAHSPVQRERW